MVSILQLVILIIPGVAFRMLILLAWCQGQGGGREEGRGVGWGGGGVARRPAPSVQGFPAAVPVPGSPWEAAGPCPEAPGAAARVESVNEHHGARDWGEMITQRIHVKNSSLGEGSV